VRAGEKARFLDGMHTKKDRNCKFLILNSPAKERFPTGMRSPLGRAQSRHSLPTVGKVSFHDRHLAQSIAISDSHNRVSPGKICHMKSDLARYNQFYLTTNISNYTL
jgi:hypothetical protein